MKPNDVNSKNEQLLLNTVYNYKRMIGVQPSSSEELCGSGREKRWGRPKAAFKVGDPVRISKFRTVFQKGYTPNWTTEIFTVKKVQLNTDPITYLLIDHKGEEIKGCFYAEELQLVKNKDIYLIEKIIRTNKNKAYVKWLGFGDEHNSWIPKKEII